MMLPTHALAGAALAVPLAAVAPEAAALVLAAGLVGGALPDLDLYVGHRRTLHFPVYYSAATAVAVPSAFFFDTVASAVIAAGLVGAAAHSVADVFGGGLELRPWRATADRAVYDHFNGRWIAPRRWIRYDGAPEDLLLSATLAAGLWGVVDGPLQFVVAGALTIAAVYTVVRRILPRLVELIVPALPADIVSALPARYRPHAATETDDGGRDTQASSRGDRSGRVARNGR
ncbi:metal-dependent hydrolase [Halobaculum halobium]|uniref:Metal-dependent hydrolase n=1 Tax=Halobaculum halobium TaxID=3032281 RepID=A0ABD5T5V7_9EURY|nr:metal-dependent hydrolase [Halobaculum sp. SYNS20]